MVFEIPPQYPAVNNYPNTEGGYLKQIITTKHIINSIKMKKMKNITIVLLFLVIATASFAQKQKGDTLVLSVYNHNARFMLTLADFGPDDLNQSIMGEMVAIYDTLVAIKGKVRYHQR
ncbi:MAG: hypothetical protein HC817_16820 [Saprospiraceae bacterium]|nr:hypothetical protein [Saprospiraceae bacterium]